MVEIADINDRESLRAWLEETSQPRKACVALAHRVVLRQMPSAPFDSNDPNTSSILPTLRALLVVQVLNRGRARGDNSTGGISRLSRNANAAYLAADQYPHIAVSYSAGVLVRVSASKGMYTPLFGGLTVLTSEPHNSAVWAAVRADCQALANGSDLLREPLWPAMLEGAAERWSRPRVFLQQNGWQFWIDWYERALAGEPQPWPLLLEIALQEDDFWQGSDDEVMVRINEIVERYEDPDLARMRALISQRSATNLGSDQEVAARKHVLEQIEQLLESLPPPSGAAGIGHNQPPDEFALDEEQISEVRTSVEALREEASSTAPNLEVVVEKASFFSKVIGWAAGKADLTVSEFCKKFGSALGVGAAADFFGLIEHSYWASIMGVFQSIKDWIAVALGI